MVHPVNEATMVKWQEWDHNEDDVLTLITHNKDAGTLFGATIETYQN